MALWKRKSTNYVIIKYSVFPLWRYLRTFFSVLSALIYSDKLTFFDKIICVGLRIYFVNQLISVRLIEVSKNKTERSKEMFKYTKKSICQHCIWQQLKVMMARMPNTHTHTRALVHFNLFKLLSTHFYRLLPQKKSNLWNGFLSFFTIRHKIGS